jgi:hypothetical protein
VLEEGGQCNSKTAGGLDDEGEKLVTSRVEMLSEGAGAFVELPPLSCGVLYGAAAIAVDERDSALGQVLLLGGRGEDFTMPPAVRLVDLATGVCTPQAEQTSSTRVFHLRRHGWRMGASSARTDPVPRRQRCMSLRCRVRLMRDGYGACWAPWLQGMRAERRQLCRPRRHDHLCVHVLM